MENFALMLQIVVEKKIFPPFFNPLMRNVVVGQCLRTVAVILPPEWHGVGVGDLSQGG